MTSALYIHIPFCTAKCIYCSFNSYAGLETLQERYVDAVCAEMKNVALCAPVGPLKTVFLGGGTPSVLAKHLLRKLFGALTTCFSLSGDAEISIEINPGTVDIEKLDCLQTAGVNRISFGVQSFDNEELKK